jgi:hypothetical protein
MSSQKFQEALRMTVPTQSLSQALISFLEESVPLKLSDDPDPAAHHWKQGRVSASLVARQKAYAQLQENAAYYVGRYHPKSLVQANQFVLEGLGAKDYGSVAAGLENRAKELLLSGVIRRLDDNELQPKLRPRFSTALQYEYNAGKLSASAWASGETRMNCSEVGHKGFLLYFLLCVLVTQAQYARAKWLANYLKSFVSDRREILRDDEHSPEILNALLWVAGAASTEQIPDEASDESLHEPYRTLIGAARSGSGLEDAIVNVMDFRMARYNGQKSIDNPKRSYKWSGILASEAWALAPVEIYAMLAICRVAPERIQALAIPHPWWSAALYEEIRRPMDWMPDPCLEAVAQLGEELFGEKFTNLP